MEIKYSSVFRKQHKKLPIKIKSAFKLRLVLFMKNPSAPMLRNYQLTGKFKYFRSINITGDWRAIYSENSRDEIIFEMIGTHSQLYK